MELKTQKEVENTRAKLAWLETRHEKLRKQTDGDQHVRELTLHSLKRLINQLKEEIARFEAHHPVSR